MEEKKTKTTKKMDLLSAIEQIVEKAKDSKLSPEFYRKASKYIKYVSDKLNLTKEQSVMLALFINRSDDSNIYISELSNDIKCSNTSILRCMNDIDELERRELIRCSRDKGRLSYRVPFDVLDAFRHDEKYVPKKTTGLTFAELFGELDDIFDLREDNEITYDAMVAKIESLFADNQQLEYVQKVKSLNFPDGEDDEMLFVLFCHHFINKSDDYIGYHNLDWLYDDKRTWSHVKGDLISGDHILFIEKLIEYSNDNGMIGREYYRMTQKAKEKFFSELGVANRIGRRRNEDIVKCKKIVEKTLYFGDSVQVQINELGLLLENSHYKEIRTRMQDAGFRCGFTCLFYGAPGTGKTETVLQLARQTGRDILQVDVSKIKSCWVGESEKNIKSLFDNYREKVKTSIIAPILLFNEADAIINKRNEGAERSVDKMENSIQNIILQEMENLDGILIATTNLAGNMDKAFERRFLYKIKFEKPTLEARMSIWHTMIPALDENVTRTLATKYDFSGGQIENIARHYAINNILHGQTDNTIATLTSYCDNERLETKENRKIGF